jgi:hypothetical protein
MKSQTIVDHFYAFNNVAVFPATFARSYFPKFYQTIYTLGNDLSNEDLAVFASTMSENLTTSDNFDSLRVNGFVIFNSRTATIEQVYLVESADYTVKTKILDVIMYTMHGDVFVNMYTVNPNFDVDATFYVKYGFVEPEIVNNVIRMRFSQRPSLKMTLAQIRLAVTTLQSNNSTIKMFIPKDVALIMSKCLSEINEAGGNMSILKYIDDVAIMGINSEDIVSGTEGTTFLPKEYSPFVFHTHPDHITREFKTFISWPSGQDMMVVALSYMEYRNQLVHFVSSPEGVWAIHVTAEFQRILYIIRSQNSKKCSRGIFEAIYTIFTAFESPRLSSNVAAVERYNVGDKYLSLVKNYTLSKLIADVPILRSQCSQAKVTRDAQLYNVSLIKWKHFSEPPDQGVFLTFDYNIDVAGGLTGFL